MNHMLAAFLLLFAPLITSTNAATIPALSEPRATDPDPTGLGVGTSFAEIPSPYSWGNTGEPFAKTNGRLFDINGSGPGYFAGCNAWWLPYLDKDADIDTVMREIADSNLKVVRAWGFGTITNASSLANIPYQVGIWFQLINSTGWWFNYGSNGLQRLDYVVSSAEKHGLKLVLPLNNNWESLGGISYYNWAYGGNASTYYTDHRAQAAYLAYVNLIVNRYKNSSAIFAWELQNEPRCTHADGTGCPTSIIYNWAGKTSAYIKSLDPDHLVTLGDEGWFVAADTKKYGIQPVVNDAAYLNYNGVDFAKNMEITTLDYGTFHLYPDLWGYPYMWGSTWINQHDLIGSMLGKPVVAEEYGAQLPHNHTQVYYPWQTTILDSSIAYDSFWAWETTSHDLARWNDPNGIYYQDSEYKLLVRTHAKQMLAKRAIAQ